MGIEGRGVIPHGCNGTDGQSGAEMVPGEERRPARLEEICPQKARRGKGRRNGGTRFWRDGAWTVVEEGGGVQGG
jgi:hypothetical protein